MSYVFGLFSAICYGSITTFATLAYGTGLQVEHLVISRGVIVASIFFGLAYFSGRTISIQQLPPLPTCFLALAFMTTAFCQLSAIEYISVGMTVILFFTFPIFVMFYNLARGWLQPKVRLFFAPFIALIGVFITIGDSSILDTLNLIGVIFALLAAIAMAASIVIVQECFTKASVLTFGFASNFLASFFGLLFWSLFGQAEMPHFQPGQVALGLATLCAVGCLFGMGILFQLKSIQKIGSVSTSMALNFEPVVTLIIAAILISEGLNISKVAGIALIVLSIFLSPRAKFNSANMEHNI